MPSRFKLILAYDGGPFEGFQYQCGHRTVQGEIETALRSLGWRARHILSAARTDSGVHAVGQVVAFDLEWAHSTGELARALNAALPREIACREVEIVRPDFHPRFDAAGRRYRYRIYQAPGRDPLLDRFAWQVWPGLDLERVQRVSRSLVGEHDFRAFGSAPRCGGNTFRRVGRAEWETDDKQLSFWMEANAFLFRMVRMTVGSVVRLGQGRISEDEFLGLLREPEQGRGGPAAPARGLCLMGVDYLGAARDHRAALRRDLGE
ncbi:MAG: tRNA pseudouridine(38-40) synthase TruA [Anaerolineales bacterium]|jgi:tRNA pseudouridine38-40 synthase